ncbi:unnamed protein product [Lota lota]
MKTDGETEVETAASCPSPGQAPIKTWLQSSRRSRHSGRRPNCRFHGDGVRYKAKLIGTDEVVQAQGDKMCLDSMMKLKGQEAASRSHGKHKQRIWLRVCSKGLKIVDEKTGCVTYEHDARRISSLRRDESDPRALAYVFQHLHSYTLFYIKTANTADPVLEDIQEVCHNLDQVTPEEPTQVSSQEDLLTHPPPPWAPGAERGPSPAYPLRLPLRGEEEVSRHRGQAKRGPQQLGLHQAARKVQRGPPPYGLPQHQQQPPRVTWGQKEGMYPGVAPTTAQLFSGPPTSGGPGTPAHPQQPFLL